MKWLILLIVISCGKHQEPAGKDFRDSDGDQVFNYEESGVDKYVANFQSVGTVKGILRFKVNETIELELNNETDLETKIPKIIVSNEKRLKPEEHFSEWAKLKISENRNLGELKQINYQAVLMFEKSSAEADEVYLESEKFSTHVGVWKSTMEFSVSAENLKLLSEGKAHFILKRRFEKKELFDEETAVTIKKKTYRLLMSDGKTSRIYYVSKSLSFSEFQRHLNLKVRMIENEDDFFFNFDKPGSLEWVGREFKNGDKVLVHTDVEKLKELFYSNYQYKKSQLAREHGIPVKGFELANKKEANVYLRIRPIQQTLRTFVETSHKRTYGEGGGGREGGASVKRTCIHSVRHIKNEQNISPDLNTLINNVTVMHDSKSLLGILEQNDERGMYWKLKGEGLEENTAFHLNPTTAETRVVIGEFNSRCPETISASYNSDIEGKLSFEVESFVEKIQ